MTVEVDTSRVSYTGAGTTGPFTIPFYFLANADIRAIKVTIADGTEVELALTTDFTLSGAGDEEGGTLTLVSSLSSSYKLVIFRDPEVLQESAYPRNDPFPSQTHERVVDRLTMISQRHADLLERSVRMAEGDTSGDSMVLPAAVDRASKYVAFDANGDITAVNGSDGTSGALGVALAASSGSSLVGFIQSGSAASLNVQEKLRQTKAVLDFVTSSSVRSGIMAGTDSSDHSTYLQSALDSDYNLDFQGYTYYANGLTDDKDTRAFVSTNGVARIIKNANGALFTSSGDDVLSMNINWRGDASSPTYTGDGAVFSGDRVTLINCGSRWMSGRALKATGQRLQIFGTCDIYQTTDSGATGYDIEVGVSGTATLYHELHGIYTSQNTGGILATDTGSMTILGGQIGKLKIDRGTAPAGVNGGKVLGVRIVGAADFNESNAVIEGNQFGDVAITFGASTSGIKFGITNVLGSSATITNNGNQNNLIMRDVSSGSTNNIKFGDDGDFGVMTVTPGTPGRFEFPQVIIPNNSNYYAKSSTGTDVRIAGISSANLVYRVNDVSNAEIHDLLTGSSAAYKTRFDNGAATAVRIATTTVNCTAAAASVTATNLIPKGARVLGVTTKVTVAIGTTNGTTGYQVGDGSDADRWADKTGTATSTATDNSDATADWEGSFTAATSVVITAKTGNFDGTGTIRITVLYRNTTALTG